MTQCLILSLMILAGESLDLKNYMLLFQRIDDVIKIIPRDRALGPDGFTRKLLKYCLHIIAPVFFYRLCADFWDGNISLHCPWCLRNYRVKRLMISPDIIAQCVD